MGAGSVIPPRKVAPSWKLAPPHDVQAQGIVVSGFNKQPFGLALFLELPQQAGPSWLQALLRVAPITDADGADPRAACIAFTYTGLQNLGLDASALASFSAPFCEGMYQEDRLRRLGDKINDAWQPTIIDGGPLWSANIPVRSNEMPPSKISPPGTVGGKQEGIERAAPTAITVHAMLLLYEATPEAADAWAEQVREALAAWDVAIVRRLPLSLNLAENEVGREHFGFADGLSQPLPYDSGCPGDGGKASVLLEGQPAPHDKWNGVPLGDILIGHNDLHHQKSPGPTVLDDDKARKAGLKPDDVPEGLMNFGLNGSYMVVRELRQDVAAFWNSLERAAEQLSQQTPAAAPVTALWLAERVVGRTIDGHLLRPDGKTLPADAYDFPENDFLFRESDPLGFGCPLGSHVRRANPRDMLAKDAASAQTLLDASNNHRILRRGRKFGPVIETRDRDDAAERGLLFICLNTDIARQFEFIQQRWLLNRNFATLYDEVDPLMGPKGSFTINEEPLRRMAEVQTFVQCAGGEYFFLPSIPALNYLATQ